MRVLVGLEAAREDPHGLRWPRQAITLRIVFAALSSQLQAWRQAACFPWPMPPMPAGNRALALPRQTATWLCPAALVARSSCGWRASRDLQGSTAAAP